MCRHTVITGLGAGGEAGARRDRGHRRGRHPQEEEVCEGGVAGPQAGPGPGTVLTLVCWIMFCELCEFCKEKCRVSRYSAALLRAV